MTCDADRGPGATGPVWVLGVDSGGSGLRIALADTAGGTPTKRGERAVAVPAGTGGAGIDAGGMLGLLLPAARGLLDEAGASRAHALALGAAGMASLGDDLRARMPDALAHALGVRRLALAADAVTAYAGALGGRPGAVVAAGTGLVALGTDLRGRWRRADGWGHLLGDCGGGAWIGRAGMEAALRAFDGRGQGSARLLGALEAALGPAPLVPSVLYPRRDRPAVLASFAPEVARCAQDGDPVAARIVREAAGHIADAAAAVCPAAGEGEGEDGEQRRIAFTGGIFGMGELLLVPVREELARLRPDAVLVEPEGSPLDGALRIAAALAAGRVLLPAQRPLLQVLGLPGSAAE